MLVAPRFAGGVELARGGGEVEKAKCEAGDMARDGRAWGRRLSRVIVERETGPAGCFPP